MLCLSGEMSITGDEAGDPKGYFAHLELINGFKKTLYWTNERILGHAKRYCGKALGRPKSSWNTNWDEMATKTMLRQLLGEWGILSVEMISAMTTDGDFDQTPEEELESQVQYSLHAADTLDNVQGINEEEELKPEF